jgi:hypothetical protein
METVMQIDLAALGLSKEQIEDRVVDACVDRIFLHTELDEDGNEFTDKSPLRQRLEKSVKEAIDTKVAEMGAKHLLPLIDGMVENLVIQHTTKWGEKVGEPKTFVEYMTERAEAYLREEVDYHLKTKAEAGYSSWTKYSTRVATMIDRHLQGSIEVAMKNAVADFNKGLVGGLQGAVKVALEEAFTKLRVDVKTN